MSLKHSAGIQTTGIQIGSLISDMKSDSVFLAMMRLLNSSKSSEIRKRVIKAMKAPYSEAALAFIGKRLRDENDDVCCAIFKQLIDNQTRIENFSCDEAKMLVIAEGLQSANDGVRSACIEFLTPSIIEHADDLSYIFR